MSSVEYLREFVNERLTVAAVEIFGVFTKTIVTYEEEISRQRKLLDVVLKTELKLHRTELPQQHVCKEKEVLQERNPSLDQEEPEPPQSKEELCTNQEGGRLVLKQETDTFMWYPTCGESAHNELNSESVFNMPIITSVVSEAHSHNQLLFHNSDEAQSQDQNRGKPRDKRDAEQKSQKIHHESISPTNSHRNTHRGKKSFKCGICRKVFKYNSGLLRHQSVHTREKPLDQEDQKDREDREPPQNEEKLCTNQEGEQLVLKQQTDTFMLTSTYEESDHSEDQTLNSIPDESLGAAGKESVVNMPVLSLVVPELNNNHQLVSQNSHEAESQDWKGGGKPLQCDTCGKVFQYYSHLQRHLIIHTGEKPYFCQTCGKRFRLKSHLKTHVRGHTGEKPYTCKICGKGFIWQSILMKHIRTHTGEMPYFCNICEKKFRQATALKNHIRSHTDEKPYSCKTCGKDFICTDYLKKHMKIHSGERPYSCEMCGKTFTHRSSLITHVRLHTGEKPYSCKTCGKDFRRNHNLKIHMTIHTGEKPYSCKTCGEGFTRYSLLIKHRKRHKVRSHSLAASV